ncbi:MAG: CheR family methyltransferase [Polyangia bacterium]
MKSSKRPRKKPPAPEMPAAASAGAPADPAPDPAPDRPLLAAPAGEAAVPAADPAEGTARAAAASAESGGPTEAAEDVAALEPYSSRSGEAEELQPALPFLVVGIGVPSGAGESLLALLKGLPRETGLAVVIATHEAGLPGPVGRREQLAAVTVVPVTEVSHRCTLEPDHVYIGAPGGELRLQGGTLVREPAAPAASPLVLDRFFRSLAADLRSHAIGVLLAGADADGALGLKSVKGEGGIAIIEGETRARAAGLLLRPSPDSIDLAVGAEQLGAELARIAAQHHRLLGSGDGPERAQDEQLLLSKIYTTLRKATGVDFSLYKQTTLRRRIARRLLVQRIGSLAEYARFLQASPAEVKELYEDMLINVTRFFRDPEAFTMLASEIMPLLLQDRSPEQPIRIWVPGCATGEEVYSLAITLIEGLSGSPFEAPIQIFGTDISERSIERARMAVYPESAVAEISPERLRRFFVKVEGGYQVVKRLRDMCVFARQNLASDPPFSRLDLISCRNVLIYLGPTLQKTIIPTFHYALKPNGFLLLGNSETIRDYSNLFVLLDKKAKLYVKNPASGRTALDLTARMVPAELLEPPRLERLSPGESWSEVELQRAADRIVLARFGPAGVIINERAEILQSRGHTSPFLELPPGTASLNLLRMVSESIAMVLREGVQRAVADDIPVRLSGLRMGLGDKTVEVTIEILPVQSHGRNPRCFLVLFIPGRDQPELMAKPTGALALSATPDDKDKEILQFRNDLASTKLYLQSLLEERDIANQELISANEEIQSSNEELQSINEELETAKEELQSTNEELQTVNEELYNRNLELGQTSNDLINLLNNIIIPVLMLGSDLRIRQFTPIAERMMNVRAADVGRPIGEIRMNLAFDGLEALLLEVIETLSTRELEVQDRAGRWHLLRARPYRTADNKIEGVVLVLVDIDLIRKSQQQLIEARDFAQAVIDSAQMPLVVLSSDLRVKTANRAFFALSNLPVDEVDKRLFPDLAARLWNLESIRAPLESLRQGPGPSEFELEHEAGGPNSQVIQINARWIRADSDGAILVAVHDITARKQAERLLRREKERLEGRVKVTERALGRSREELRALAASLFTAHEEERRRVSRELHDDLAQKVALLEMNIERLHQQAGAPALRTAIALLRTQIAELSDDLRRIAYQLHPAMLDDLGLSFALKSLVEEFGRREGVPVTFTCRDQPKTLPPLIAGSLYRIAQEALRNIAKHAGKAPVRVQLVGTPRELRLQIQDQGRGFEPGEARVRGGMGILNMEERARLCGGTFRLKSRPGEGVTITVRVPRPAEDA